MAFWKRKTVQPVDNSDGDFVDAVAKPLWDVYLSTPERLGSEQLTVMDVWSTKGAIDNGGLPHFIETTGHRGAAVVSALCRTGLAEYADVIQRTLRLYTTANAEDPDERLSASDGWEDGGPEDQELEQLDDEALRLSNRGDVERAAAAFIRANWTAFQQGG